jgi:hypothetical protein
MLLQTQPPQPDAFSDFLRGAHKFLFRLLTPNADNILMQRELNQRTLKALKDAQKELDTTLDVQLNEVLRTQQEQRTPQDTAALNAVMFGGAAQADVPFPEAQRSAAPQLQEAQVQRRKVQEEERQRSRATAELESGFQRVFGRIGTPEDRDQLRALFEMRITLGDAIPSAVVNRIAEDIIGPTDQERIDAEYRRLRNEGIALGNERLRYELDPIRMSAQRVAQLTPVLSQFAPQYRGPAGMNRFRTEFATLLEAEVAASGGALAEDLGRQFGLSPIEARAIARPVSEETYGLIVANLDSGVPIEEVIDGHRTEIREWAERRLVEDGKKTVSPAELLREEEAVAQAIRNVFTREFFRSDGFSVPHAQLEDLPISLGSAPASSRTPGVFEVDRILREMMRNFDLRQATRRPPITEVLGVQVPGVAPGGSRRR